MKTMVLFSSILVHGACVGHFHYLHATILYNLSFLLDKFDGVATRFPFAAFPVALSQIHNTVSQC